MIAFCFAVGYFPASGYRILGDSNFSEVGLRCLQWSSSSFANISIKAAFWDFRVTSVRLVISGDRGAALSVRCVQELTSVFIFMIKESTILVRSIVE